MAAGRQLAGGNFTATHHSTTYDYISPLNSNLAGKHILITGTAWETGVGYATATAFARAGASAIALADLHGVSDNLVDNLKAAAADAGRPEPLVLAYTVDITNHQASVQALHDTVSQRFNGRLDILINNAAHTEPYQPLLDADPAVCWRTWEVNVGGLLNMTRAFLPMLLSTRHGASCPSGGGGGLCTIINVASSGALSARPGSGSYRSSKLAVLRLTETLQLEYGDQGLVAYCVNPGAIRTRMTEHLPETVRASLPDRPDVAGDTVAWLAAERREWLGGRYVSCPWDMEELLAKRDAIVEKDLLKMRMLF